MKKLFILFAMSGIALFLCSQVMAETKIYKENVFDARLYHESSPGGSSMGGWKLGLVFRTPKSEMTTGKEEEIKNYAVEFVNKKTNDAYSTTPWYCFDMAIGSTQYRECDAHVWFGNRLTVAGTAENAPPSDWDIYLNGSLYSTVSPVTNRISEVPFVNLEKIRIAGPKIQLTYSAPELADTHIQLRILDSDYNFVQRYWSNQSVDGSAMLPLGSKQNFSVDRMYSGYFGRFEFWTNDNSVRKILWFKLP